MSSRVPFNLDLRSPVSRVRRVGIIEDFQLVMRVDNLRGTLRKTLMAGEKRPSISFSDTSSNMDERLACVAAERIGFMYGSSVVKTKTLRLFVSFSTSVLRPGIRSMVTSIFFINESRKERIFQRVSCLEEKGGVRIEIEQD